MKALANSTKMCYTCDRRLHLQYNMEVLMNRKITLFFRALALLIDLMFCEFILMLVELIITGDITLENNDLFMACALVFLVFRDLFGRSLGKCLLGIKIIDIKSGQKAKWYQRVIKNITTPLTMVEGIVLMASKGDRRWGDFIGKTRIEANGNSYAFTLFNLLFNYKKSK